jgi:hypothetical protein
MDLLESNAIAVNVLGNDKLFKSNVEKVWRPRLLAEFHFDVWKLPVCERCEGWGLWDGRDKGVCHKCGHTSYNPLTVEQFYEQGLHVDRTVHKDAPRFAERGFHKKVATAYGGEAGLADKDKKFLIAEGG